MAVIASLIIGIVVFIRCKQIRSNTILAEPSASDQEQARGNCPPQENKPLLSSGAQQSPSTCAEDNVVFTKGSKESDEMLGENGYQQ